MKPRGRSLYVLLCTHLILPYEWAHMDNPPHYCSIPFFYIKLSLLKCLNYPVTISSTFSDKNNFWFNNFLTVTKGWKCEGSIFLPRTLLLSTLFPTDRSWNIATWSAIQSTSEWLQENVFLTPCVLFCRHGPFYSPVTLPTYSHRTTSCRFLFEELHSFTDIHQLREEKVSNCGEYKINRGFAIILSWLCCSSFSILRFCSFHVDDELRKFYLEKQTCGHIVWKNVHHKVFLQLSITNKPVEMDISTEFCEWDYFPIIYTMQRTVQKFDSILTHYFYEGHHNTLIQ